MKHNLAVRLLVGAMALGLAALQSSCSTSSSEAWSKIQSEGLIPYIVSNQAQDSPLPLAPQSEGRITSIHGPELDLLGRPTYQSGVITAQAVDGKPGFVYSPHTEDLLEVDVTDYQPGERVRCPYTKLSFVVPGAPEMTPDPQLPEAQLAWSPGAIYRASDSAPAIVRPRSLPAVQPRSLPIASTKPEPDEEIEVNETLPLDPIPGRIARNGNQPPSESALLALPKRVEVSAPVATRVPGKPNYVYSPYAASNQVVDVEGHAPGTKVKCPYTGKIFAVPSASEEEAPEPTDSGS